MKLIKGMDLNPKQKQHVLNAFIYRLTTENGYPKRNPCGASVPAKTDEQWLKEYAFWFKNDGSPSSKYNHCEPAYLVEA